MMKYSSNQRPFGLELVAFWEPLLEIAFGRPHVAAFESTASLVPISTATLRPVVMIVLLHSKTKGLLPRSILSRERGYFSGFLVVFSFFCFID